MKKHKKTDKQLTRLFICFATIFFCIQIQAQHKSSYRLNILQHTVPCSGTPQILYKFYNPYSNFGTKPHIAISPNADNSYNIAWLDTDSNRIKISCVSAGHQLIKEVGPAYIGKTGNLCGFTSLPDSRGFIIGYSKDNAHGNKDMEFWITHCDTAGNKIYNTCIFGQKPNAEIRSKGYPCRASTARIIYSQQKNKAYFYLGHTMKWEDGIRHQGGYFGYLDMEGRLTEIDGWHVSHNFNQRIIENGGNITLYYHGDAYPRALGIDVWNKNLQSAAKVNFLPIAGKIGDNYTNTAIGNILTFGGKNYGAVFTTGEKTENRMVFYVCLQPHARNKTKRFRRYYSPLDGSAISPQIAKRGNGRLVIAYEEFKPAKMFQNYDNTSRLGAVFFEIDHDGNQLTEMMRYDSIKLQPMHDMAALPNGNIIWAVAGIKDSANEGAGKSKFTIYEIPYIENNRRLYDSYGNDYEKCFFSGATGGFCVSHKDNNAFKRLLDKSGQLLTEQGYRLEKTKHKQLFVNDLEYEYVPYNKLSFKPLEKTIKEHIYRHHNVFISWNREFGKDAFISMLRPLYNKMDEDFMIIVVHNSRDVYYFGKEDFEG